MSMAWEVSPWKPMRELEKMKSEMDNLWDSFFETGLTKRTGAKGYWLPALDVSESETDLVVEAELPGVDEKDIDISLSDGLLTIRGERKQGKERKETDYHLVERSYGSFTRLIRLPKEVKTDKISASFKDGILKITSPKSEEAKKKEIKIKVD
jgi:HSP20 family protein